MVRHNKVTLIKKLAAAAAVSLAFVGAAQASTEPINIGPNGETIWADDTYGNQAISANGSIVIIGGIALPPGQLPQYGSNVKAPVWSRDRQAHSTQMLSKTVGGAEASYYVISGVSANGRYATFDSFEDNLVSGDTNGTRDSFVVDRNSGTITQVNVTNSGAPTGYSLTGTGALSGDGRYVVFQSSSQALFQNTVPDSSGRPGVFVRDLIAGTTKRINVTSANTNGTDVVSSWPVALFPQISGDGRFIAFSSPMAVAPNGNGLYLRDQLAGTTSALPISATPNNWTMSANGRYVAYYYNDKAGSNFTVNVLDRQSNTVETIYQGEYRTEQTQWGNLIRADRRPMGTISMSANGRYVTFGVADSQEGTWGTNVSYVFDRQTSQIANLADYGAPGRPQSEQTRQPGLHASLSGDGRHILVGRVALANPLFQDDGFCSMYNPYISE